jgi:hypothetical protein
MAESWSTLRHPQWQSYSLGGLSERAAVRKLVGRETAGEQSREMIYSTGIVPQQSPSAALF